MLENKKIFKFALYYIKRIAYIKKYITDKNHKRKIYNI